jgi:riboflavin synthase
LFTGIVEDLGEIEAVDQQGDFAVIYVRSSVVTSDARVGDSICVSGVCLTVTSLVYPGGTTPADLPEHGGLQPPIPPGPPAHGGAARPPIPPGPRGFTADVMGETLRHSSLKSLSPGTLVNLERSVRLEDRLGGHLVQGHTDGTGTIQSRVSHADWDVVRISLPADLARYVVHKGSITVDGISLTVSSIAESPGGTTPPNPPEKSDGWFEVSLIPETLKRTTLGAKQPGDEVNLEVDVIAKYVERLLPGGTALTHRGPAPDHPRPRTPRGMPDEEAKISDMRTGGTR